jgi:polysaccharide pyruvyl transferase WcaK-like protein
VKKPLKILLGGVPFGRDNVGDEAILECTVQIIREICPDADITVSTDDGEATASRLNVKTVELFGFAPPYSRELMCRTLEENDVFIWSGATGLSDYPEIPLEMLSIAREAGTKTVLWGVGMNNELTPYKYKLLFGKRWLALRTLSLLTLNRVDFVSREEQRREDRARAMIAEQLGRADLVVLRDPETLREAQRFGEIPGALVGTDSAVLTEPAPWEQVNIASAARQLLESDSRKVGVCISAQREISNTTALVDFLNRITNSDECSIIFLPMNPKTDAALMTDLQRAMKKSEKTTVITEVMQPPEVLAIAARLDVVISSRLHLLLLAANQHIPIVGISRGSKIDNYLAPYGLKAAGSVDHCDFDALCAEVERLLEHRDGFVTRSREVRADLLQRLETAKQHLAELLNSID